MNSDQKYRMTHQRQVILEEINKDQTHPTADEIYERVRKKLPRISMGTVYRNLEILSSCGIIHRLEPGLPQMRFDCVTPRITITSPACNAERLKMLLSEPLIMPLKTWKMPLAC